MKMIGASMFSHKPMGNQLAVVTGLAAIAGVALVCAIPKTRNACLRWIDNMTHRMKVKSDNSVSWQNDLTNAEKLKGTLKSRKNASAIKVPSAGTTAWKDEWSSE